MSSTRTTASGAFTEVADRVWVATQEWCEVNVTVVAGSRGVVVVDTGASGPVGARIAESVRRLGVGDVLVVANTHWHHDHTFGNDAVLTAWPQARLVAHETAAAELAEHGEPWRRRAAEDVGGAHAAELAATTLRVPEETFSAVTVIDLGDRQVEVLHPGAGHTGGDAVLRVGDVDTVVVGDLVEATADGGSATPAYGDDSHPLAWPGALDVVLDLLTPATVVIPGHGGIVDRDLVEQQRNEIGLVAQAVRDAAANGVPAEEALAHGTWPYPREHLADAVRRGYAALPVGGRRLPMV